MASKRPGSRLRSLANLYYEAVQELQYMPSLRRAAGIRWAARAYVILGSGMRCHPGGWVVPGW